MKLDKHIVDMFADLTKPVDDVKMEKTCYGTISVVDGTRYVKLDGSDLLVPAASTVKTSHGDRVTVLMRNHTVVVTGNLTAPSSSDGGSTSETVPEHSHTVSDITDFPESLPADGGTADIAKSVETSTGKAKMWEDIEGGNMGLTSPDGTKYAEMDIYDNTNFRMYFSNNGTLDVSPLTYNFSTKKMFVRGNLEGTASNATNADMLDGYHSSYFARASNLPLSHILSGQSGDIRTLVWNLPLGGYATNTTELPNITFPVTGDILLSWTSSKYSPPGSITYYYGMLIVRSMTEAGDTYICSVYNKMSYTDWQKLNDGGNADTLDGFHANEFSFGPNLLVNPNYTINQNGKMVYDSGGNTVDYWTSQASFNVTPLENGIRIEPSTDITANMFALRQIVPVTKLMHGKNFTFSTNIEVTNDYAYMALYVYDATNKIVQPGVAKQLKTGINSVSISNLVDTASRIYVQFMILSGAKVGDILDVLWSKFEFGTIATPFYPPDPDVELLKIQAKDKTISADKLNALEARVAALEAK